jgi:hypothetical protein
MALVRERTIPTERPSPVGEVSADKGRCRVVSAADPYGRNLGFLDRTSLFLHKLINGLFNVSHKLLQRFYRNSVLCIITLLKYKDMLIKQLSLAYPKANIWLALRIFLLALLPKEACTEWTLTAAERWILLAAFQTFFTILSWYLPLKTFEPLNARTHIVNFILGECILLSM